MYDKIVKIVKIAYYFGVRMTQWLIVVAEGEINQKRLRTTGLRQKQRWYDRLMEKG